MADDKYDVEVENTKHVFRFRLTKGTRKSGWATYAQIAMLDDTVAVSPYWAGGEAVQIMQAGRLVKMIAIGEAK